MPLAGLGSRFIALLLDLLIWCAGLLVLILLVWMLLPAVHAFSRISYQWAAAIVTFLLFLANWGYFTLFEAFWHGRTPGKRIAKIRVIQRSGQPIGLFESMARNFVRYIDQIPFCYAVGCIAVFASRQHQRLGDLAAGTLVVRDEEQQPAPASSPSRTFTASLFSTNAVLPEPHTLVSLPVAGITKLSPADLEVLENFLARRLDMPLATRQNLAGKIAAALLAKSGLEAPEGVSTETFLEAAARELRDVARMTYRR